MRIFEYGKIVEEAAKRIDPNATSAQREALNFRHGHVHIHNLPIGVEWAKGDTRTGVDKDGKSWSRKMHAHYGRVKRTLGKDGDPVDVYIGDQPSSQIVFVISQLDSEGNLDEHKCILGTTNLAEAKKLYLSHYPDGWENERLGEIRMMVMPQFKKWLKSNAPVKNKSSKKAFVFPELPPLTSFVE